MCATRKPFVLRSLAAALCVGLFSGAGLSAVQAQAAPAVVLPPVPPGVKNVPAQVTAPTAPLVAPAASVSSVTPTLPSIPPPPIAPGAKAGQPLQPASVQGRALGTQAPATPVPVPTPADVSRPKIPQAQSQNTRGAAAGNDLSEAFAGLQMTPVSESQLNRFIFPEPIEGIYFSEGAPLPECAEDAGPQDPCKPVFLNGKRMMLLQLRAGAKGPVQMLVHLASGRVLTMNLAPTPGPGAIVRVEGAEDGASDTRLLAAQQGTARNKTDSMSASEQWVALLARFARGELPPGFEAEHLGPAVRFDFFDVIPQAAWGNGSGVRAHLFQVRAHGSQPVAINSGLFRTENVKALALDRETISQNEPAFLYVLEHLPEIE